MTLSIGISPSFTAHARAGSEAATLSVAERARAAAPPVVIDPPVTEPAPELGAILVHLILFDMTFGASAPEPLEIGDM